MFYSNIVFKGLEMSATTVTALIGVVNFVASFFGLVLLIFFGYRSLMLLFNALMAASLILLATFSFNHNTLGMVTCVLLFIVFFEFSSGTIVWIYNSEILQDKAIGIATFLNMMIALAISVSIPLLVKKVAIGYIFLTFGILTTIGTIFIAVFMVETRGKTQEEV